MYMVTAVFQHRDVKYCSECLLTGKLQIANYLINEHIRAGKIRCRRWRASSMKAALTEQYVKTTAKKNNPYAISMPKQLAFRSSFTVSCKSQIIGSIIKLNVPQAKVVTLLQNASKGNSQVFGNTTLICKKNNIWQSQPKRNLTVFYGSESEIDV